MKSNWFPILLGIIIIWVITATVIDGYNERQKKNKNFVEYVVNENNNKTIDSTWVAPSLYLDTVTTGKKRQMVIYGQELIAPFGPYADNFTEEQHKYGPYQPIVSAKLKKEISNK